MAVSVDWEAPLERVLGLLQGDIDTVIGIDMHMDIASDMAVSMLTGGP